MSATKIIPAIDGTKAIEFLLSEMYFKEFEVSDGLNQHPDDINFYEWIFKKGFISKEELTRIGELLDLEEDD